MKNVILSLKNIYMVLMSEDFPTYSERVISRKDRKGLTMLRFWQGILVAEFRCLPCGQMLWRADGKRNRYTSYLCNRSAEIKTYQAYARELSSQIREDSLKKQIAQFQEFLSARKYRHDILLKRVRELIQLARTEDPRCSDAIAGHILRAADWPGASGEAAIHQAAYLLSMLTLYAAAGEAMDGPDMALLRSEEFSVQALWNAQITDQSAKTALSYLTVHSGLLQDNPLPRHRFFGREEELFELKELAASGRKLQLVGMGGLGKTELLRQLIRICKEDQLVDKLAIIPYEGDIIESFARSFPGFRRETPEESFHNILHRLAKESIESRILLVIDNLTNTPETDPALGKLRSLPCGLLVSARRCCLENVDVYPLPQPSASTSALIFRDNYGLLPDPEDRKCLSELLEDQVLCHPLTLRLMAGAARSNGWSVQELKTYLEGHESLSWQKDGQTVRLNQIYRQLYSYAQIPEEGRNLAELFTLLPRDSYPPDFLREWFPEIMGPEAQVRLEALAEGGWLDRDETGYSMHPLIAQCLRRRVLNESHLLRCMGSMAQRLRDMDWGDAERYGQEQSHQVSVIFCHAADFLTGPVSASLMCAFLRAGTLLMLNKQEKERFLKRAERMLKRCAEPDDRVEALYCTACGRFGAGDRELFTRLHTAQKESRTIPERMYLDLCLSASFYFGTIKEYEAARGFAEEVLAENAAAPQKAHAYYQLIGCFDYSGNREESRRVALEGAEYALANPGCGEEISAKLLNMACQCETVFGNKEGAQKWLEKSKAVMECRESPSMAAEYAATAANYELYFGDLETAHLHFRRAVELAEALWERDTTYYLLLGQLAIVLQRLKRYKEAIGTYQELLAHAEATKDTHMRSAFRNNLAVAYLELEQPAEALAHLDVVLALVRSQGGIALAEAQRNRARAFGQLGDREQEYACLLEASPLLDASYGPDHPRSIAARQRLAELKEDPAV